MNDEHVQRAAHALRPYVALLDTGTAAETALAASGLVEENNRLRAALVKFSRHLPGCGRKSRYRTTYCTCGLDAALSSPVSEETER